MNETLIGILIMVCEILMLIADLVAAFMLKEQSYFLHIALMLTAGYMAGRMVISIRELTNY